MSKVKLLFDVVNDMRSLADSIEVVCKTMTENDAAPEEAPVTKTEPAKEPDIPLEKVRMVLAEKSQLGFTAQVREIIGKYGADKLSAVDKAYYADILKDAEVLGNG
ncbi:rRNA biogenesis protein rrp5 [Fusibacter tunisiensis]|uniref:rRNA biogenesis protein rrp5 n=1 Tax=Fusibacter tunisiensis TaxID=1008308 RepID=A0ABS2MPX9_9FIRM|nr:rRNA biogenesis protein rrp5 [Fusibacter tunisiensis]MBM7561461.1 hypothetical protein [Fusibacter tunisiensis]